MKPRMTESEWERIVADAFSPDAPEPSFSAEYLAKRKSLERRIAMNKPKRNRVRLFKANEDAAIQKGKNAGRLLPWHIAIGITAAACAILAVSVGIDVVGRNSQMQVGTSNTTTASTQTAKREPVKIIDKLAIRGGADQVMKQVPQEGAVQVLRCVKDADAFCQYSDETINNGQLDYRQFLTEEVFAQYDVLYFGFKDKQFPLYNYRVDLTGGGIAADGKTLEVDFIALVHDPEHLPPHTLHEEDYEPYWNSYYFYKVPKGSLPDLNKLELHFDEYPIGEIPDDLLKYSNGYNTANETIVSSPLQEYLEKTQEYCNYISSVPEQVYITWGNGTKPPVDCDVVKESAKDSEDTPQVTLPAETLESYAYARNINNMHMMQIGETAEYFYGQNLGVNVTVESVAVQDNFAGLKTDAIGMKANFSKYLDGNGKITATREAIKYGDGINTLNTALKSEQVRQYAIITKLKFTNNSDKPVECLNLSLSALSLDGTQLCRPVDVKQESCDGYRWSDNELISEGPHFSLSADRTLNKNNLEVLNPGDSAEVTFANLVDEDAFGNLYLRLGAVCTNNKEMMKSNVVNISELKPQ